MSSASSTGRPVHVAITRHIKAGCEAEFQEALGEFLKTSFGQAGVHGASMLVPLPGSTYAEYGILRTFANEQERDAFYESAMFRAWKERVAPLTEGDPQYRQLHGLEAWFRNPTFPNPPQWKMALLTFIAVWPVSVAVPALLNPLIGRSVSNAIFAGAVAGGIVAVLTWGVMPILVRLAGGWLYPKNHDT
jgi:antibiotic biosynthesis monooxygenase (ABM) superfamily enzyme